VGVGTKKNPHGILDWIADFFVRPIEDAIKGILGDLIVEVHKADLEAAKKAADTLASSLPFGRTHSPLTNPNGSPAQVVENLEKWAKDRNVEFGVVVDLLMGIELVSAGQIDVSPQRLLDKPQFRAVAELATDVFQREWRTGLLPQYDRFYLKKYTPLLPGYMDMIGIYVREGYLAEKWVELPPEFAEYMKELGYSEDWTKRLWGQHWVLPGVTLLYEMFHKKIIDYKTMVQMLKYHDFEPVWRDRLIANAYALIPRVDLRRGYAWGLISGDQLQDRYERLGFSPDDATSMTGIAKRYGLSAYYSRLLSVAAATFRKGQLSGPDFQTIMEVCGLPGEAQDLMLDAESMARDAAVTQPGEEPRILSASQVCAAYTKGLLSLSAAKERLLDMGFLEGDADLLLALAAPKPLAEAPATEIVSAASLLYRNGWMSPEEFEGWLRKARLTDEEIAVTRDAQDLRYWLDYASDLLALWKQMYAKDIITLDEFYTNLLKWGCQPDRAWAIVQLEETRKIPKPRLGA